MRRKLLVSLACAAVLTAALFLVRNFWKAHLALGIASAGVAASRGIDFTIETLGDRARGRFERPLTAAGFRSVAEFAGDLYVSSHSSLRRYSADGSLKQTWFVGVELPPYPLESLAVRRGIGTPELWIATEGAGVLIYDGKRFRQLLPAHAQERKISALLSLSNGRVVLGTPDAGVLITDTRRLDFLHPQFAHTRVTALAGDEDELWIGTRDAGVWLWRSGEATHFLSELPDPQVLSICKDGERTWVGTPFGIAEFASGRFTRPLAEGVFAQSVVEDGDILSVGTVDEGIVRVALAARLKPAAMSGSAAGHASPNILELKKIAGMTLAVSSDRIALIPSGDPVVVAPENSLSDGHVSALHLDSRGRLWIGYFDRGLDIAEPGSTRLLKHIESDVLFCVNRIREDPETHTTGVATANGLALFDSSAQLRQTLDSRHGLMSNHVTDVLFSHSSVAGQLSFAAATPAGITFVDGGSFASLSAFQGLVNNHVYTLAGNGAHLLAGTLGGFSLLGGQSVRSSYSTANSALRQNWITASAAVNDDFYLGTYGSGVIRVGRDGAITRFRDFEKERIEINPHALLESNGVLYAGTAGQGLAVLRLGGTRWQFVRQGLPSLSVTALAEGYGVLYVGTDNGLVRLTDRGSAP
ncbi:MAG TPA: two-component regulator propeller domain-containing protein [Bryobacteraceae bacterium]